MKLCEGMAVTFHRAFDMCQNPMVALEQLTELGVARILTSGQQQSAELGLPLLRRFAPGQSRPGDHGGCRRASQQSAQVCRYRPA